MESIAKKIIALATLLLVFFFVVPYKTQANVLYSDAMAGPIGTNWSPLGWTQTNGQGIFSSDGVLGFTDIYKEFNTGDITIQFDYNIHAHDTTILFACRANSNYSDVVQAFLDSQSLTHIDECDHVIMGTGSCIGDLSTSGQAQLPYDQSLGKHHIEYSCIGNNITEKEDGNTIFSTNSLTTLSTGVRFAILNGSNSVSNLKVCDGNGCPSTTPTPTPLPVPDIKQTSSPWNTDIYDSADKRGTLNPTINAWGCALTSAVMILRYNGITKMPGDNADITPRTLNNWLKSEEDGYTREGYVNWIALQRLTKLARLANNNPAFLFDALVYRRAPVSTNTITSDLQNNIPDILELPNHFVVAKGMTSNGFAINDPFFARDSITNADISTVVSIGKYIPSHTDLSYIMLVTDPNLSLDVKDSQGNSLGTSFVQEPLQDDTNPGTTGGIAEKIYLLEAPTTGGYSLLVSGPLPQNYHIDAYLYDLDGNVSKTSLEGALDNTDQNTFTLSFDKNSSTTDSFQRVVTIDTLIFDIRKEKDLGQIKNGVASELLERAKDIKKDLSKHHNDAKSDLKEFMKKLNKLNENEKKITPDAYSILSYDVSYLLSHL